MDNSYHDHSDAELRQAWTDGMAARRAFQVQARSTREFDQALADVEAELAKVRAEWIARGLRG